MTPSPAYDTLAKRLGEVLSAAGHGNPSFRAQMEILEKDKWVREHRPKTSDPVEMALMAFEFFVLNREPGIVADFMDALHGFLHKEGYGCVKDGFTELAKLFQVRPFKEPAIRQWFRTSYQRGFHPDFGKEAQASGS